MRPAKPRRRGKRHQGNQQTLKGSCHAAFLFVSLAQETGTMTKMAIQGSIRSGGDEIAIPHPPGPAWVVSFADPPFGIARRSFTALFPRGRPKVSPPKSEGTHLKSSTR